MPLCAARQKQYLHSVSTEWEVVARGHGSRDVMLLSQINATFSVSLCAKGERSASCQSVETHTLQAVCMQRIPATLLAGYKKAFSSL